MSDKTSESFFGEPIILSVESYLKDFKSELDELIKEKFSYDELKKHIEALKKIIGEKKSWRIVRSSELASQLELRKLVKEYLQRYRKDNCDKFVELACWVIQEWGGIPSRNNEEFIRLHFNDDNSDLNSLPFERIASSSKVASFIAPEKYVVYDSRVAHALNWILLVSPAETKQFFPVPEGRNSKLVAFDIKVLIRLSNIEYYCWEPRKTGSFMRSCTQSTEVF